MKALRWSTLLPYLFAAGLAWSPIACGGDDDDPAAGAGSGGSSTAGMDGGAQPARDCANRCGAIAGRCGAPAELCAELCASATESQLACAEGAGCEAGALDRCLSGGSGGSGTGGGGTGGSGTGGSGTGGSGTGGSGALPDTINVSGRRKPGNEPTQVLSQDQTQLVTNLNGGADVEYTYDVAGNIDISKAASRAVTTPMPNNCAGINAINLTLSASEAGFVFVGTDVLPATDCSDFADAIQANGLTVRFTDVPLLNGSSKVKELILQIRP